MLFEALSEDCTTGDDDVESSRLVKAAMSQHPILGFACPRKVWFARFQAAACEMLGCCSPGTADQLHPEEIDHASVKEGTLTQSGSLRLVWRNPDV